MGSGRTALEVLGKEVDVMKLQSCLTLLLRISPDNQLLQDALNRLFAGQLDSKTLAIIEKPTKN